MSCANNEKISKFYSVQTQLHIENFIVFTRLSHPFHYATTKKKPVTGHNHFIYTIKTMTIFSQQGI